MSRYGLYKHVQAARQEIERGPGYWRRKAAASDAARAEWQAARDAWEREQADQKRERALARQVKATREYRARKRRAGQLAPEIDTLGLALPDEWARNVSALQARLRQIASHAMVSVGAAEAHGRMLPRPGLHRLLAAASALRSDALAMMPASVCPYCRLVAALLPDCSGCQGRGYLTADALASVPSALLRTDHPLVRGPDGAAMAYADALLLTSE